MLISNGQSKYQKDISVNGNTDVPSGGGASVLTGDAVVGEVLDGKLFYSDDPDTQLEGTMANNTDNDVEVEALAGTTIPAGYYNGSGKAILTDAESTKFVAANIKDGVTLLGVAGSYDPEYITQTFLADGTFNVPAGVGSVDAFLVGGGGGGAGDGGGGGGGYTASFLDITTTASGAYSVVVGAGGDGEQYALGGTGGKSWFKTEGSYYANGGAGGTYNADPFYYIGGNGGSGGGSNGAGGSDGSNGSGDGTPGTGQGTTTRMFGKSVGQLFANGGGYGAGSVVANTGYGGNGGNFPAPGASGIVVIRYQVPST